MAPAKPPVVAAATPKYSLAFDAFNSSSTGHQCAENRLGESMGWRQSRNMKLNSQLKSQETGGRRIFDQAGEGSEDWDENAKALIPGDARRKVEMSVRDMLVTVGDLPLVRAPDEASRYPKDGNADENEHPAKRGIFDGLVFYVNGSTYPLISDHKLKHILAENGGEISFRLGRRKVTHVILGKPCGFAGSAGAGGGLAATKIQKEIKTTRCCSFKNVGVEWVLESVKAGKRLPEARFSNLKVAHSRQRSMYPMLKKSTEDTGTKDRRVYR